MRTDTQGLVTVCLKGGHAEVWTQKTESVTNGAPTKRSSKPEVFG